VLLESTAHEPVEWRLGRKDVLELVKDHQSRLPGPLVDLHRQIEQGRQSPADRRIDGRLYGHARFRDRDTRIERPDQADDKVPEGSLKTAPVGLLNPIGRLLDREQPKEIDVDGVHSECLDLFAHAPHKRGLSVSPRRDQPAVAVLLGRRGHGAYLDSGGFPATNVADYPPPHNHRENRRRNCLS
jgi:hypothetical protein